MHDSQNESYIVGLTLDAMIERAGTPINMKKYHDPPRTNQHLPANFMIEHFPELVTENKHVDTLLKSDLTKEQKTKLCLVTTKGTLEPMVHRFTCFV